MLGSELHAGSNGVDFTTKPDDGRDLRYWFIAVPEPKMVKNRVHIDIILGDEAEMERIYGLGATKVQEVRDGNGKLEWTVLGDVEGNEFCAFPPKGD